MQNDIINALLNCSQYSMALEQIGSIFIMNSLKKKLEIYLIEKFLEYLDNRKESSNILQNNTANKYENNQNKVVKIKVFEVLSNILMNMNNSFLSFLIIDVN